jgi:hypothetical protein
MHNHLSSANTSSINAIACPNNYYMNTLPRRTYPTPMPPASANLHALTMATMYDSLAAASWFHLTPNLVEPLNEVQRNVFAKTHSLVALNLIKLWPDVEDFLEWAQVCQLDEVLGGGTRAEEGGIDALLFSLPSYFTTCSSSYEVM